MRRLPAIALSLLLGAGCFAIHESSSPENVIDDLAAAIADRDVKHFEAVVDEKQLAAGLDRYIAGRISSAPPAVREPMRQIKLAPMALGAPAAADVMQFVETGRFARSPWLAYAAQIVAQGERDVTGSPVKIDANTAEIRLRVSHSDLLQPFTLQLDVRRAGSSWRLVDVANLSEFLSAVDEARERRLTAANGPLQLAIDHAVALECNRLRGSAEDRILQIVAKNRSSSDISALVVHTSAISHAALVADGFRKFTTPIAAGDTKTLPMRDPDFEFNRGFAAASASNLSMTCEATEVDFADGRILRLESTADLLSPNLWQRR